MDRNQTIGIILIMLTFMLWTIFTAPSPEEIEKNKIEAEAKAQSETSSKMLSKDSSSTVKNTNNAESVSGDTLIDPKELAQYGVFATSLNGKEQQFYLENDFIKIVFTNKGGNIKEVILKQHNKTVSLPDGKESKELVKLMDSKNNEFYYTIPNGNGGSINTNDLYFEGKIEGNKITFSSGSESSNFIQEYVLGDDYTIDYKISTVGMKSLNKKSKILPLTWVNHLNKLEKGEQFEQNYSTVYFKELNKRKDYCSCVNDDKQELPDKSIEWVSHVNQFFNTSLIGVGESFIGGTMTTTKTDLNESDYVKITSSEIGIPIGDLSDGSYNMKMYIGPNEFVRLKAFNNNLEEIIPFGSSIFGTINRWLIRPFFDFLSTIISSKGIVIILLTFLIKMLLYPLMYKMLLSQAKMGALKPEITQMKEKYKDDMQKQQMETMKLYQEYGVSPLGGCLPMVLQMPIWYALFRFFPASITFRQEPFLWATDLSSYDVLFDHGIDIPFMGTHISLFTLLWAVSTVAYTYYNMQNMDLSANPALKYVQYFMPLMFLGFFNSYAAGLTCYMLFSNLINILQTVVTKNYIFDESKLRAELMQQKAKPKKKSGFASRLEEAMKQQQAIQEQRKKKK